MSYFKKYDFYLNYIPLSTHHSSVKPTVKKKKAKPQVTFHALIVNIEEHKAILRCSLLKNLSLHNLKRRPKRFM